MSSILQQRGISGREGGHRSTYAQGLGISLSEMQKTGGKGIVTIDNVHNLSLYELRQMLKGRGEFLDDFEGNISFEILLKRMVVIIEEEKALKDSERFAAEEAVRNTGVQKEDGTAETVGEKLAREKMERKREAEERSKQRQADKAYFKMKGVDNSALEEKKKNKLEEKRKDLDNIDADSVKSAKEPGSYEEGLGLGEKEGEVDDDDVNPFKLKYRSKIGGKYA